MLSEKRACLMAFVVSLAVLMSCSLLGSKTELRKPEAVGSINKVVLAPIWVDAGALSLCSNAEEIARARLLQQIDAKTGLSVMPEESLLTRVATGSYASASQLISAAGDLGFDAVIFCKVEAAKVAVESEERVGWGLGFDSGGVTLEPITETVTSTELGSPTISLQVVEAVQGDLVIQSDFDVTTGKSYWTNPAYEKQIADGVDGALKPIIKIWRK